MLGREIFDAHQHGTVSTLVYADDLKQQLDGWWDDRVGLTRR
jgi:hypothetical protein